jgi:Ser/Thr protein kinase RdoA (MazF antagonist)
MNSSAEQLPSDQLLSRCAEAWGLRNMVFVRKMENIVFACECADGKVYLRLTTPLRRVRPEIEAEINWIEHLAKCGLKVPRLIPDREGNKMASFTEGEQHFEAVVFSALAGEHPSKEIATDPKFLKTLGALIAKMHQASQHYEGAHQEMKREEWFEERGLRHALTAAATSKHSTLRHRLEEAVSWMQHLQRTPETYGLVHADLGALNLFVEEEGSIGIIDFDDSCYHWFVFDLAIVIFSIAGGFGQATPHPEETKWLANLIEGYRTVLPLSQREVDLIPKLIEFACLRLFFWIEYHESLHTFHDDAIDKVAQFKQWTMDRLCSNT